MKRPPKNEDIPIEKGVQFERGAPGFTIEGEDFWVRRLSIRAARDFARLVPEKDMGYVEQQEALLPMQHLLRDANGDPPSDDEVLDGTSPRDAMRFIAFAFGGDSDA